MILVGEVPTARGELGVVSDGRSTGCKPVASATVVRFHQLPPITNTTTSSHNLEEYAASSRLTTRAARQGHLQNNPTKSKQTKPQKDTIKTPLVVVLVVPV